MHMERNTMLKGDVCVCVRTYLPTYTYSRKTSKRDKAKQNSTHKTTQTNKKKESKKKRKENNQKKKITYSERGSNS